MSSTVAAAPTTGFVGKQQQEKQEKNIKSTAVYTAGE